MLTAMRKSASGFLAKLIILLLIVSLGVWGIGDMVRGSGNTVVAEVGRDVIYTQDFLRSMQILQANLGENFTLDSMRQSQFPELVLNELIDRKVLELTAKDLGLHLSDGTLLDFIIESPLFRNADNEFDKNRFIMVLQNSGMTEEAYLQETREGLLVNMLQDTALMHNTAPVSLSEALFKAAKEQRSADLLIIDPLAVKLDEEAPEEALEEVYSEISPRFASLEQKTFSVLTFSQDALRASLEATLDEEALRGYYDTHIDFYTSPASREVYQLTMETEEAANAAFEEFQATDDPASLFEAKGAIKQSYTQSSGLSEPVTDAVFSLGENALSPPIESDFGWQILFLTSIQKPEVKEFNSIKESIRSALISEQLESYSYDQANALEDALAGGSTFDEAVEELSFATELQRYDTAKGEQTSEEIMQSLQTLQQGDYSGLQVNDDGLYYFVVVDSVTPSQIPPLEEIRKDVVAEWEKRTRNSKAREMADAIAKELAIETPLEEAIADKPVTQTFTGMITRNDNTISNNSLLKDKILTRGFTRELFTLQKGDATGPYPLPSGEFIIGILKNKIEAPKPSASENVEDLQRIQRELAELVPNEIYSMWMQQLRSQHDVVIHQDVVNAVLNP